MTIKQGTEVIWQNCLFSVVAYLPATDSYVLAKIAEDDGDTPGEQWEAPAAEVAVR